MSWSMKTANFAHSHLADAMNVNDTAVKLLDSSAFPTTFPFNIVIDDEIMVCVAHTTTTNTLIVLRAAEYTTAVAHEVGTEVSCQITAGYMADLYERVVNLELEAELNRTFLYKSVAGVMHPIGAGDPLLVTQRAAGHNMSVDIAEGDYLMKLTSTTYYGTSPAHNEVVTAAHATLPRKDAVRLKYDGTIDILAGTPAEFPVNPYNPFNINGYLLLAEIFVLPAATSIVDANIIDRRIFVSPHILLDDTAGGTDGLTTKAPTSNALFDTMAGTGKSARVTHNAAQSIPDSTNAVIAFNTETYDTDAIHDAGTNTRLTCKTAGKYIIGGHISYTANTVGIRAAWILLNGTTVLANCNENTTSVGRTHVSLSIQYNLAVNDYVELYAWQNSGGALDVDTLSDYSPVFEMIKIV